MKTLKRETVIKWKWWGDTGRVVFNDGKFCVADRIVGLWGRFNGDKINKRGQLSSYKGSVQPYIYFTVKGIKYRTPLFK